MLEEKVEGLCIIQGLLGKYGVRLEANILFCLKKSGETRYFFVDTANMSAFLSLHMHAALFKCDAEPI